MKKTFLIAALVAAGALLSIQVSAQVNRNYDIKITNDLSPCANGYNPVNVLVFDDYRNDDTPIAQSDGNKEFQFIAGPVHLTLSNAPKVSIASLLPQNYTMCCDTSNNQQKIYVLSFPTSPTCSYNLPSPL